MQHEMLWIDLETTGLSAQNDIPLELGLMLTDKDGGNRYSAKWLIWEPGHLWAMQMGQGAAHEVVGPMHQASGLWDDLVEHRSKALTRTQVDQAACRWLEEHDVKPFTLPMAGSSIGSLDRPFVIKHFPDLHKMFHYRNIDISTVKELCKMHNPEVYSKLDAAISKQENHRVLDDIRDTIDEYRFYVDNFLWT